jgi:hypothetical protein
MQLFLIFRTWIRALWECVKENASLSEPLVRIFGRAAFALLAYAIRHDPYPTVVGFADAASDFADASPGFAAAEYRLGGRSGSRKPRA